MDVSLDGDGSIVQTQCDCAAGMGLKAHCKHICTLLYAIYDFTCNERLLLATTCTQELQTFHKSKPFLASPLKADVVIKKASTLSTVTTKLNYDPRHTKYRNAPGYNCLVRNQALNYCYQSSKQESTMPLLQMYGPANLYAMEKNHRYFSLSMTDKMLEDLHTTKISPQTRQNIEQQTRGQSANKRWLEERCIRLHAPFFGKICKATNRTDKLDLARRLTTSNDLSKVRAIKYGRENESAAITKYEEISGH